MIAWIKSYIESLTRSDRPEQTPWAVVLSASAALILILAAVGLSCALRVARHGDLGGGAVTALGLVLAAVTTHLVHSNSVGSRGDIHHTKGGECSTSPKPGPIANAAGNASVITDPSSTRGDA